MQQLQRHKFNIFPEASKEDFERLVSDMRKSGYDESLPITIYQGDILDGWNRYRACVELGIQAATTAFDGTDADALDYTLRTNKRRNLSSSQWAAVAVEAEELLQSIRGAVEAARLAKQKAHAAHEQAAQPYFQSVGSGGGRGRATDRQHQGGGRGGAACQASGNPGGNAIGQQIVR